MLMSFLFQDYDLSRFSVGQYNAALAARGAVLETDAEHHHFWGQPMTIEHYIASTQAALQAPPSPAPLATLPPA